MTNFTTYAAGAAFEAAPKGGYSSRLTLAPSKADGSAGTFTATYVFDNAATAAGVPNMVATGGGNRLLSWMVSA